MISEAYRTKILQASVSERFDPKTEVAVDYYPDGKLENRFVFMDRYQGMSPLKPLISDLDGVLNRKGSTPPTMLWLEKIFAGNYGLRSKKEAVANNIVMLERGGEPEIYASRIERDFRENGLTQSLYLDACERAATEFEIVRNYYDAHDDLRSMGYRLYILTASPRDLVSMAQTRLMVKNEDFEASNFQFDEFGNFKQMEINLGETRASGRDRILQNSAFTKYGLEITIDDNPVTGSKIVKSGWPHAYFWLGAAPDITENVSVNIREARDDFTHVSNAVERMEAGYGRIVVFDDRNYRNVIEMAHDLKDYSERLSLMTGLDFREGKIKALEKFGNYISGMRGLYNYRRNNILDELVGIKNERDETTSKILLRNFTEKFYNSSLEAKLPIDSIPARE